MKETDLWLRHYELPKAVLHPPCLLWEIDLGLGFADLLTRIASMRKEFRLKTSLCTSLSGLERLFSIRRCMSQQSRSQRSYLGATARNLQNYCRYLSQRPYTSLRLHHDLYLPQKGGIPHRICFRRYSKCCLQDQQTICIVLPFQATSCPEDHSIQVSSRGTPRHIDNKHIRHLSNHR